MNAITPSLRAAHTAPDRNRRLRFGGFRLRQLPNGSFARASFAKQPWAQFDVLVAAVKAEQAKEIHDYAKVTRLLAEVKDLTGGLNIWEISHER